jgi:hypothetical protein
MLRLNLFQLEDNFCKLTLYYQVTYVWLQTGYGFVARFIYHLYTRDSELYLITALSLISTLYNTRYAFFPAVVPWQRLLTVDILQLHTLRY